MQNHHAIKAKVYAAHGPKAVEAEQIIEPVKEEAVIEKVKKAIKKVTRKK